MTSNNQRGYAFAELLIASAIFSLGILAVTRLQVTSQANLMALQRLDQRFHQAQDMTRSASITPSSPNTLLTRLSHSEFINARLGHDVMSAPLYSAEISLNIAGKKVMHQYVLGLRQSTGDWADIAARE